MCVAHSVEVSVNDFHFRVCFAIRHQAAKPVFLFDYCLLEFGKRPVVNLAKHRQMWTMHEQASPQLILIMCHNSSDLWLWHSL